ncbi:MAG: response regulator [Gammaproteobacteria bacterium]|jgi:DNA-binding NtrC family response regulator|nr:response regulator [Gammaproteobacteria bacterium]
MHASTAGAGAEVAFDQPQRYPTYNNGLLIVDDEPEMRRFLKRALGSQFTRVETAGSADEARARAQSSKFDLLIADIRLPGAFDGRELAREFRVRHNDAIDVILMTGFPDLHSEVVLAKNEADKILKKPFQINELQALIKRVVERRQDSIRDQPTRGDDAGAAAAQRMMSERGAMQGVWDAIRRIAPTPTTVLITGETGSGKEVVARALHDLSGRTGAYVPINCGAISAELIESELFGHVKGAFTGAHQARTGLFGHAEGGTLFLDEVGEMPLAMQAKLLRVLEERRYRPVGGTHEIDASVRVITATNRDLAVEVEAGRFRKDLFYRLNVVDIRVPPLRERPHDILLLADYFLEMLSSNLAQTKPVLTERDRRCLLAYDWPGNCRELRNVIERSLLFGQSVADFLPQGDEAADHRGLGHTDSTLEALQRAHILQTLRETQGNKSEAARVLGVSRKTIERKVKEWSLGQEADASG